MESYVERLLTESEELSTKIDKLRAFIEAQSPAYCGLPAIDKALLQHQLAAMVTYLSVLSTRVERAIEKF